MHLLRYRGCALALLGITIMALPRTASAVPSFARQTGMPARSVTPCHLGPR